jgi:hypothetical protein
MLQEAPHFGLRLDESQATRAPLASTARALVHVIAAGPVHKGSAEWALHHSF